MTVLSVDDPEALPDASGAYVLVIDLIRPVSLSGGQVLRPGRHAYAGSARGPGGIRARCRRHLKAGKAVRWHVDRLTNAAGVLALAALSGGRECAVVEHLVAAHAATVPVRGFGSSDCRRCAAHLVRVADDFDLRPVAEALSGAAPAVIWRSPPPSVP